MLTDSDIKSVTTCIYYSITMAYASTHKVSYTVEFKCQGILENLENHKVEIAISYVKNTPYS